MVQGVRQTHGEFQHLNPAIKGSRVKGLWGFEGLDPLKDCSDSSLFYGFGTFAAGLVAGLQYGVAKNATIYSGGQQLRLIWVLCHVTLHRCYC